MARALAWHARGRRFDPDTLHKLILHLQDFLFMAFYVYILYSSSLVNIILVILRIWKTEFSGILIQGVSQRKKQMTGL